MNTVEPTATRWGRDVIGFSFPVLPKGLARIGIQTSAAHEAEHTDKALAASTKVGKALRVVR